ncbi:alpha/beta hydrolase [Pendulispora rubella]|uniref:Alpha/beta hydrolase n=1 Tax=Pendulispora rubella TaxID=2741070 RepID=A0ABZ2KPU4_9BACT
MPACRHDDDGAGGAGVTWTPCPLVPGGTTNDAECTTLPLPLAWDHPGGSTIPIFVKHVPAAQPSGRQVWLLAGGPGGSGDDMVASAQTVQAQDPTLDIYLPDHRGTGQSKVLFCPEHQAPGSDVPGAIEIWSRCLTALKAEWGDGLRELTITNAARDLGALIWRMRHSGDEVHVMGVSYGTFWAQRYLQLFPRQPTSVTLDSVGSTEETSIFGSDALFDDIVRKLMAACGQDPFCSGKLGPDPMARTKELFDALDTKTVCAPLVEMGLDRRRMRRMLALFASVRLRVGLPAMVYRAQRCAPGDVVAFQGMLSRFEWHPDDPPSSEFGFSDALYPHIILSEDPYGPRPPSLDSLLEAQRNAYASIDESTLLRRLWDIWPRYPREALSDQYPNTHVPVFLINGDLDPQTRIEGARRIAEHYTRPYQTFVEVPNAGHIALSTSQVDNSTVTCGNQMWIAFMHDPEAPIDTSCLAHLRNLPFEGDARTARVLFRTTDLWENP